MPEHRRIEEIDLSSYHPKILVYGPWGSGKTWFCGTAPRPHFLCTEEGLIGLRIAGVKGGYSTFADFRDYLVALGDLEHNHETHKVADFDTICLDGLSELCFYIYREVQKMVHQETLRIQDWGLVTDRTRMSMNQLLSLGKRYNIIATAREEVRQDSDTNTKFWGPDILGAYKKAGPGAFDVVLYAKQEVLWKDGKREAKFSLSSIANGLFPAKDRTGTLNIEEPNYYPTLSRKIVSARRAVIPVATITS